MRLSLRAALVLAPLAALAAIAQAQVPPGFQVSWITHDPIEDRFPRMNNRGQVVFTRYLARSPEIFLYDHGRLLQLTDDDVEDGEPDINDDGTIVWVRTNGPMGQYGPCPEIVIWHEGELTQLTDDQFDNLGPRINNLGHVVWQKYIGGGCLDENCVICFWDGSNIAQVSDADSSHSGPALNDHDEIVWTRFDLCQWPWTADIFLYSDGVTTQLTDGQFEPQTPDINNQGQVVWMYNDDMGGEGAVQLWQYGQTVTLTNWGEVPHINDLGEVLFYRLDETTDFIQMWLYRPDGFYQLTGDETVNVTGDINDCGEGVWTTYTGFPESDIRYLRRTLPSKSSAGISVAVP